MSNFLFVYSLPLGGNVLSLEIGVQAIVEFYVLSVWFEDVCVSVCVCACVLFSLFIGLFGCDYP